MPFEQAQAVGDAAVAPVPRVRVGSVQPHDAADRRREGIGADMGLQGRLGGGVGLALERPPHAADRARHRRPDQRDADRHHRLGRSQKDPAGPGERRHGRQHREDAGQQLRRVAVAQVGRLVDADGDDLVVAQAVEQPSAEDHRRPTADQRQHERRRRAAGRHPHPDVADADRQGFEGLFDPPAQPAPRQRLGRVTCPPPPRQRRRHARRDQHSRRGGGRQLVRGVPRHAAGQSHRHDPQRQPAQISGSA